MDNTLNNARNVRHDTITPDPDGQEDVVPQNTNVSPDSVTRTDQIDADIPSTSDRAHTDNAVTNRTGSAATTTQTGTAVNDRTIHEAAEPNVGTTPTRTDDAIAEEQSGDAGQGAGVMGTMLLPAIILFVLFIAVILWFVL